MEPIAILSLVLFLASEIIPHLPFKGNSVVESIIGALRKVFPYESHTSK